ncbi:hypothetical protein L1887_36640 [Cichorium endivia]|nr:hypothetical protein L1887_36640 [Cichorium endivia]
MSGPIRGQVWYQIVLQRLCSKAGDDKLNPSSSFKFVATLFYSSIKNIPQIFFLQIFRLSSFTVHLFSLAG